MYKAKNKIIKINKIFNIKTIDKFMFSVIIERMIRKNNVYFSMPGNKYSEEKLNYKGNSFFDYDLTELSFSDNLMKSKGIIKNLEEKVAKFYKCKKALIFTNGATCAIMTAIFSIDGKAVLIGNNHKSVYNSLMIKEKKYINYKSIEDYFNSIEKNNLKTLEKKENEYIIVTAPNYYGENGEIEKLYNYCRDNKIILVIDASHSAHYGLEGMPERLSDKADLVIVSMHKTLPVLTGGAVLCVNNDKLRDKTVFYREIFHTSSPSYPVMYSIDKAIECLIKNKDIYVDVIEKINGFKQSLNNEYKIFNNDDVTRLIIMSENAKFIAKFIEKKHKIYCEMISEDKMVLIVTPFNCKYLNKLKNALLDKQLKVLIDNKKNNQKKQSNIENAKINLMNNKINNVDLKEDFRFIEIEKDKIIGCKLKGNLSIYPPGTPFLKNGEVIENQHIDLIKKNINKIIGIVNNKICVYND